MTTNETCPHCGAEKTDEFIRNAKTDEFIYTWRVFLPSDVLFSCGTGIRKTKGMSNGTYQSQNCINRQIAAQAAEFERLTERNKILAETVRIACEEYPFEVK